MATAATEFQLGALVDVFGASTDTTPIGGNGLKLCQPFVALLLCRLSHAGIVTPATFIVVAGNHRTCRIPWTPPDGWGVTKELLIHPIRNCKQLVAEVESALKDEECRPFEVDGATKPLRKHGGDNREQDSIGNLVKGGNNKDYTASRLARDNPELHEQVRNGALTLNQAAIQAGWRKPPITISQDPIQEANIAASTAIAAWASSPRQSANISRCLPSAD